MRHADDVFVSVISSGRSANVPKMEALVGDITWFVGEGERTVYTEAGAKVVYEGGGLCASRNMSMDIGFKKCDTVLQLSDDMIGMKRAVIVDGKPKSVPYSSIEAISYMVRCLSRVKAHLAGGAPTANAFYFSPNRPFSSHNFIVGDFSFIRKTDLRYDESMTLKEDYDYTMQHINLYGSVLRANGILPVFKHRTNAGGAVTVRTPEEEQKNIAILKCKWPGCFRDNKKRPNEVIMRPPSAWGIQKYLDI